MVRYHLMTTCRPAVRFLRGFVALFIFTTTVMIVQAAEPQPKPPSDFNEEKLSKVQQPTDVDFLHDGSVLITDQAGKVYLWKEVNRSSSNPPPAILDLGPQLCVQSTQGLLGIVVDPVLNPDGSEYVYLFFTVKGKNASNPCPREGADDPQNGAFDRLSRFTVKDGQVVAGSELIILDRIPSRIGDHTGSAMFIAQDGYLYLTTGDGDVPDMAARTDSLRGKVLRINRATGDGAPGNPYTQDPNAVQCGKPGNIQMENGKPCREVFARGLRHPWRMALKPGTDPNKVEFYINDVGKQTWEEINIGAPGANYGWDAREGPCTIQTVCTPGPQTPPNDPILWYLHKTDSRALFQGCAAVTGGAFVPPGIWPAEYNDDYLFGDYTCGRIWRLEPDGQGGYKVSRFVEGIDTNSVVTMKFGPAPDPTRPGKTTQALYYTVYNGGGQLRRLTYAGENNNHAPVAAIKADKTFGASPLTVTFDGSASNDYEDDPLTYMWNFGDGGTASTSAPTVTHEYTLEASKHTQTFTATLVVQDAKGATSQPEQLRIDLGNTPPVPTILSPNVDMQFYVGQIVTLSGSAVDPEDGPLGADALAWEVRRHHDDHYHGELSGEAGKGNNITLHMTEPEGLSAATSSYFEIILTARDALGLTSEITQALRPHLVDLTFRTEPSGMQLVADDTIIDGQGTVTSWEGYAFTVSAPIQQDANGQWMVFTGWAAGESSHNGFMRRIPANYWSRHAPGDNEAPSRTIVTPAEATNYTAIFEPLTVNLDGASVKTRENAGQVTFTVRLNALAPEPVTVDYTTVNGTATAGSDYMPVSGTLSLTSTAVITVPLLDDDAPETQETFSLMLSSPSHAALGAHTSETLAIFDNEGPYAVPGDDWYYMPLVRR